MIGHIESWAKVPSSQLNYLIPTLEIIGNNVPKAFRIIEPDAIKPSINNYTSETTRKLAILFLSEFEIVGMTEKD